MLLCIDIGNTNIVIGVTDGEAILNDWRLRTEKDITDDELGILIANLFAHSKVHADDIEDIIISCVVPPLLNTMEEFARRTFNVRPLIVGPGLKTGMPIQYDNPREVGADRIVNAVAAYEKYRQWTSGPRPPSTSSPAKGLTKGAPSPPASPSPARPCSRRPPSCPVWSSLRIPSRSLPRTQ
jgi:hypothetical protein